MSMVAWNLGNIAQAEKRLLAVLVDSCLTKEQLTQAERDVKELSGLAQQRFHAMIEAEK